MKVPMMLIGLLLLTACGAAVGGGTDPVVAVFTSGQIWSGDNGVTIKRLGLPQQAILRAHRSGKFSRLPVADGEGVGAELSPTGERIAITRQFWDDPRQSRTEVTDASGRRLDSFAYAFLVRWSPDGRRLAALFGHAEPSGPFVLDSLGIWSSERMDVHSAPSSVNEMAWRTSDSLLMAVEGHVEVLDVTRGRITKSTAHAPSISPDGDYSVAYDWAHESLIVFAEREGLNVSQCAIQALLARQGHPGLYPKGSFWTGSSGADQWLCLSTSPTNTSPARQAGCQTILFDPRTLEVAEAHRGKLVVPTWDRRSAVVLRDDALVLVAFHPAARRPSQGDARIRIEIAVDEGGFGSRRSLPPRVVELREGDWLPHVIGGPCAGAFRVLRIEGADRVVIEVPADPFGEQAGTATITRVQKRFSVNYDDAGYVIALRIVS